MENLSEDALNIVINDGDEVKIVWKGRSENRDPSALLKPYFDTIIESISGKSLEIDFTNLDFMNSSTVPPIIYIIKELNTKGISTKIVYKKDSKWQAASFKALETITMQMDTINVIGK